MELIYKYYILGGKLKLLCMFLTKEISWNALILLVVIGFLNRVLTLTLLYNPITNCSNKCLWEKVPMVNLTKIKYMIGCFFSSHNSVVFFTHKCNVNTCFFESLANRNSTVTKEYCFIISRETRQLHIFLISIRPIIEKKTP